jgi:acyl-CoA thioesterase-1
MKRGRHDPSERAVSACQGVPPEPRRYGTAGRVFNALGGRVAGTLAVLALVMAFAATPALARVPELLAFGDSLTAGYGLPSAQAFPAQLQAKLKRDGIDVRILDAGNSGDTTAAGLARLDWSLADKPAFVMLELGANDMLRGIDPASVRANLQAIIVKIQATGAKLMLFGMMSTSNWGTAYQHQFDSIFPDLARQYHVPLYPFFLDGVAMKPELNQADGLHPNAAGVGVLVDRIAPFVARFLEGKS